MAVGTRRAATGFASGSLVMPVGKGEGPAWTSFLRAHRSTTPGRNVVVTGSAVFRVSRFAPLQWTPQPRCRRGVVSNLLRPLCPWILPRRDSAGRHKNAKLCLNHCLSCKNGKLSAARQAGEVARMVHKVGMLEWDIRASQAGVAGKVRPGSASAMTVELGDVATSGSGLECS